MLSLLIVYFIRTIASENLTAVLYDIDLREDLSFDLRALLLDYGRTYNYSVILTSHDVSTNWTDLDLILMDANNDNLDVLHPNPFILTSIVPYYHMILVIPSIKQLNKSEFYLMPFSKFVLAIHLLSPIYFAAILKIASRNTRFMNNLIKTMRMMLTGSIGRVNCDFRVKAFYFVMLFYSVFMSMAYSSFLGSLFTSNNVDRTDFVYMCSDSREELLNLKDDRIKFIILPTSEYFEHVLNLDMNYGYCLTSLFWYKNFGFQRTAQFLFRPVLSNEFVYGHYLRINKNSMHLNKFNEYLLTMYSYGFMAHWGNQMVLKNYRSKAQTYLKAADSIMVFQDLQFILIVFGCCLFVGTVSFLIEVFLGWLK